LLDSQAVVLQHASQRLSEAGERPVFLGLIASIGIAHCIMSSDGSSELDAMLILIAEDLDDARHVLKLLLELDGHQVREATNGRQAVEVALRDTPDVVLMDLNMPIMDGLAAARCLRSEAAARRMAILALSAQSDTMGREEALAAGCDDYFSKPVDFEALSATLMQLARERRQALPPRPSTSNASARRR
jgi:two-component system, cell cycle response regulator DivK